MKWHLHLAWRAFLTLKTINALSWKRLFIYINNQWFTRITPVILVDVQVFVLKASIECFIYFYMQLKIAYGNETRASYSNKLIEVLFAIDNTMYVMSA